MEPFEDYLSRLNKTIDDSIITGVSTVDKEMEYLQRPAPNIIEWVTDVDYWNIPSTFDHWGQYQTLRDAFNLRCVVCNSQDPEAMSVWGKSREYLESEVLLIWSVEHKDFVCPKCSNTMFEFITDGIIRPYNEMILIIGMRAGKSYTAAHIGGYVEHLCITIGIKAPGALQAFFGQEKSETFEVTFAASTAEQVEKTVYAKYRQMRKNSPWLKRYMTWVQDKSKKQMSMDPWKYKLNEDGIEDGYLQIRYNRVASDSSGIAGKTRLLASIDEWARLIDTGSSRSSQELYRVLNTSLATVRGYLFEKKTYLPPFGWMPNVTSPISQDDPAMLHYRKTEAGELKNTYGLHCATWEFNPFLPRKSFDDDFEKDPIGAERDFGANPPNAATPLVLDPLRFWGAINYERSPIASFEEEYRTDKTGALYVAANLVECELIPRVPHYIFGDAGVNFDSFSLACGHGEWMESGLAEQNFVPEAKGRIEPIGPGMERFGLKADSPMALGLKSKALMEPPKPMASRDHPGEILVTIIDFVMRIVPTNDRDVWFQCIINIISNLKKRINVVAACFDRWSSDSTIQQTRDMGISSYKVSLKVDDFVTFVRMAYNNQVSLLPPDEEDKLNVDNRGNLILGRSQLEMSGEGVGIVEMMKLNRSPDLKKVYNPNKGKKRGIDSDDIAHCMVGVHGLVQDSIVDRRADTLKKREMRKKQITGVGSYKGKVHKGKRGF